jgi:hypothetical protein
MNKLHRNIVDAIVSGDNTQANKLFELAMAKSVKDQMNDYKEVVGKNMFESTDSSFIPAKQDFTVHAIDPDGSPEHLPDGMPVQYKVNSYGPAAAYKHAMDRGHTVEKIVNAVGEDVTEHAKSSYEGKSGNQWPISESVKIVSKHGDGKHTAKVYKDSDWDEYRVKFFKDGKHVGEDGDYHTDDLDDAKSTAESQIKRYQMNEATADDVETWKQKVKDAHPDHADKFKFKSADQGKHIDVTHPDHPDRSFGVYDIASGKGHILGEDTAVGNVAAELAAQEREAKKQEDQEKAEQSSQQKAPTIQDVMSVLGNTTSVADTSAVN